MTVTDHVRYPPASPEDLLEYVGFIEQLNARMRELRDNSALPRTPVTMPDEFDGTFARMVAALRAQGREAAARGETILEARLEATDDFVAMARWGKDRLELLEGLIRAGMVQPEWERPLKLMLHVSEHVYAQLPEVAPQPHTS